MFYQGFAYATAINHVEDTGGHAAALGRPDNCVGNLFCSSHVAAVGFEYYRTTRRERGGGIAAGRGESQREITCTKHSNRTDCGAVLAKVRAWQRLAKW
ncbi:hypothetical protein D3C84_947230 [compost metagenome]